MTNQYESAGDNLLVLGASTRAAAFSARRAGLKPICADLFADRDLLHCCSVTRINAAEFPHGLEHAARQAPPGPWLYVGALENWPDLVASISSGRPLWGTGAEVLRRVRDPFELADCFARANLPHPAVRSAPAHLPTDASWLVKPIASAGGRGICEYNGTDVALRQSGTQRMYFQQRVHGPSCAALFVGDSRRGTLIGLTRQLVGEQSFHARPFHYCGSIGPLPLEDRLQRQLIRLGDVLVAEFGLIGLFGVDGVLVDGEFWPVEVNPRYTASAEVLEFALGLPLMALQRDACANRTLSLNAADRLAESGRVIVGKAILFAARVTSVPDLSPELCRPLDNSAARWPIPRIADVPFEGEQIAAGRPICTVFAIHSGLDACHAALTHAARSVYCQFELSRSHAAR